MALSCAKLSAQLEETLQLQFQPVAMAFVAEQPQEVPRFDGVVPSSCAFWRRAEEDLFFATAEDHFNCPLGAMVMGFPLPEEQMERLTEELGMMCGINYVRESELEHLPQVAHSASGIVYGPLWRFPLEPDLVLLWLAPQQAMMMSECCGLIDWASQPAVFLGRPACAALPAALAVNRPAQSLGCVGMRTNTGVPPEVILMAVPRNMLDNMESDLVTMSQVHSQMESHYLDRIASLHLAVPGHGER